MKRRRGNRNLLIDWCIARSLQAVLTVLARLPAAPAYRVAAMAGWIFWCCSPVRRRRAQVNLAGALGPDADPRRVRQLARRSFGSLMKVALDFARLPRVLARGNLMDYVEVAELDERLTEVGTGELVFASGHLGGWEVAGAVVAARRRELNVIARKVDNPFMDAIVKRGRESTGLRIHPRRGGIKPLVEAVDRGADAALLIDQNQRKRGLFLPFFGRIASTDRSAAVLAMRRRRARPVLVGFAVRVGAGFRFRMVFAPVITPTPQELADRDLASLTGRITAAMEGIIRAHPEQYLWLHNRYKTQPDGDTGGVGPVD